MSAVDASKGKLHIKPRFVPYIEKYRIFDLLYDIAISISTHKPQDHILFVRNLLEDIGEMRDKPRIILMVPPHMSVRKIAEYIKEETGVQIITFEDVIDGDLDIISSSDLVYAVSRYIDKNGLIKTGWIMYEFPRNFSEAKLFQKHGLYPTHTFQICSSPDLYSSTDAWFENIKEWPVDKFRESMADFKRRSVGIRRALMFNVQDVPVNSRTCKELAKACVKYTKIPVYKGAPMLPRVVLIGTRGSRRRTVAKLLAEKFRMVHDLILQGKHMDNEFGEKLRAIEIRNAPIYSKLVITMLQQRLLQRDCLHRGWVLTNFPRDVADFRVLDSLDTPPNKVIFLSVENSKAYQRLKNRKINIYDGEVKTINEIMICGEDVREYFTHPREYDLNVCPEQDEFAKNVEEMLKYCGENCYVLDGHGTDNEVLEKVANIVKQPGPIAPPRNPDCSAKKTSIKEDDFVLREPSHTSVYPNIIYEKKCLARNEEILSNSYSHSN